MRHTKIVVVGPGEAGKSTLVALLCRNAVNLEVGGRTVALDHGTATFGNRRLTLIGMPGQPRFAPVRDSLLAGADAAIWVHPAGESPDAATVELLGQGELRRRPLLVVVNVRASGIAGVPFELPATLPPPRRVLSLNLGRSTLPESSLVEAVWSLVEPEQPVT